MGLSGYAEISDRTLMFDTGLKANELEDAKKELYPKVKFYKDWLCVTNLLKYDPIKGTENNLWKAYQKELELVPEEIRREFEAPSKGLQRPLQGSIGIGKGKGNEGGVGETKPAFRSFEDLSDSVVREVAKKHGISDLSAFSIRDKMKNWMDSKGKIYKDYKAGFENWVIRTIEDGKVKQSRAPNPGTRLADLIT